MYTNQNKYQPYKNLKVSRGDVLILNKEDNAQRVVVHSKRKQLLTVIFLTSTVKKFEFINLNDTEYSIQLGYTQFLDEDVKEILLAFLESGFKKGSEKHMNIIGTKDLYLQYMKPEEFDIIYKKQPRKHINVQI